MKLIAMTLLFVSATALAEIPISGRSAFSKGAILMKCQSSTTVLVANMELDSGTYLLHRVSNPTAEYFLRDYGYTFPISLKANGTTVFPEHYGSQIETHFLNGDVPSLSLKISRKGEATPAFEDSLRCQ